MDDVGKVDAAVFGRVWGALRRSELARLIVDAEIQAQWHREWLKQHRPPENTCA